MPRIHRTSDYLIEGESAESVRFDLIYRPEKIIPQQEHALIVDYDLSKLSSLSPSNRLCCELEDVSGSYERLLIQVTPFDSLKQVKRDLYAASGLVSPEGELRITVPPKSGAKRIASDLKPVFGQIKAVKSGGRALFVCRQPRPAVFWEETRHIEYFDPVSEKTLKFLVRSGIFSSERIDAGTEFLLSSIPEVRDKRLLDVGCGYGAVGVVTAARGATVVLLDVDARAVKLAEHNLHLNGLPGEVLLKLQPYDFAGQTFDVVLSNPPTHGGSETLRALFEEMSRICKNDGYIALVVRAHLNYEKWLEKLGSVKLACVSQGYKVLSITK